MKRDRFPPVHGNGPAFASRRRGAAALLALLPTVCGPWPAPAVAQTPLTTVRIASRLDRPLYVTHAPGDTARLFIAEQSGRIKVFKNGVVLTPVFLNLDPISTSGGERGLLGLAFHPDYGKNGFFYVNYTNSNGDTVVARYSVSSNPDIADGDSGVTLLQIDQPFANHNGGWLAFGPDGYLYVATGDGGDRDDPDNRAQNPNDLLGKLLRIDVNGDDFPDEENINYAIPPDNPFVGVDGRDEIWAYGLRNPWRCAFDTATGDLYIADVGQDRWEEVNFQPASSNGGENYGWRCMEANDCTDLSGCTCEDPSLTAPIHDYFHSIIPTRCSVSGGEVYRGCAIPDLAGTYFFADYCSDDIWSFRYTGSVVDFHSRSSELAPGPGLDIINVTSFGRDARGEIYICDHSDGEVFRIVRGGPPSPLAIVSSEPPDGAIDAAQPFEPDGGNPGGWNSAEITFSGPVDCLVPVDFRVEQIGGTLGPPGIAGIEAVGATTIRLTFTRTVEPRARTRTVHIPSGSSTMIAWLPADVNGDGTSGAEDLLALIAAINGADSPPIWSIDIDRSGELAPADVIREVDLLVGGGVYPPMDGATLP